MIEKVVVEVLLGKVKVKEGEALLVIEKVTEGEPLVRVIELARRVNERVEQEKIALPEQM